MLARLAKKFFARCGTRLQSIEAHALGCDFVLVTFLGLIERVRNPRPLAAQLGKITFHVTQTTVGRR